jgi:uncharacterized metal-binding protein
MPQECCETGNNIMILACSGGSNVGQLSNRAAVELTRDVPLIAAIDGCSVGCAKFILKNADVSHYHHIVVTDLGIEKNKNFNLNDENLLKVKQAVAAACSGQKTEADKGTLSKVMGCCG